MGDIRFGFGPSILNPRSHKVQTKNSVINKKTFILMPNRYTDNISWYMRKKIITLCWPICWWTSPELQLHRGHDGTENTLSTSMFSKQQRNDHLIQAFPTTMTATKYNITWYNLPKLNSNPYNTLNLTSNIPSFATFCSQLHYLPKQRTKYYFERSLGNVFISTRVEYHAMNSAYLRL